MTLGIELLDFSDWIMKGGIRYGSSLDDLIDVYGSEYVEYPVDNDCGDIIYYWPVSDQYSVVCCIDNMEKLYALTVMFDEPFVREIAYECEDAFSDVWVIVDSEADEDEDEEYIAEYEEDEIYDEEETEQITKPAYKPQWVQTRDSGGTNEEVVTAYAEELVGFLQDAVTAGRSNGETAVQAEKQKDEENPGSANKEFFEKLSSVYAGGSKDLSRLPEYSLVYTMYRFATCVYSDTYTEQVAKYIAENAEDTEDLPSIVNRLRDVLDHLTIDMSINLNNNNSDWEKAKGAISPYIQDWNAGYGSLYYYNIGFMDSEDKTVLHISGDILDTTYGPMLAVLTMNTNFREGGITMQTAFMGNSDIISRYYISPSSSVPPTDNKRYGVRMRGLAKDWDYDSVFHQAEVWSAMGAFVSSSQYDSYCSSHPDDPVIYSKADLADMEANRQLQEDAMEMNATMENLVGPILDAYLDSKESDINAKLELWDAFCEGPAALISTIFSQAENPIESKLNKLAAIAEITNGVLSGDEEELRQSLENGLKNWWE